MFHTRQLFVSLLLPLKRPKRTFYTVTTFVLPSSSFDASGPKRKEEGGRETGERKKKKEEFFSSHCFLDLGYIVVPCSPLSCMGDSPKDKNKVFNIIFLKKFLSQNG